MAMAARMPTMATAIMSSIRVNPFFTFVPSRCRMSRQRDDLGIRTAGRTVEHRVDILSDIDAVERLGRSAACLDVIEMMGDLDRAVSRRGCHLAADHRGIGTCAP